MVKPDEIFVQIVPPASAPSAPASMPVSAPSAQ
jgi:hypothetical protein